MRDKAQAAGRIRRRQQGARGFTLIELAIATAVLLAGVVMVMQLVPASLQSNLYNRYDSKAMVLAQRELEQMIAQPLTATQYTDADGNVCQLGGPAAPNVVVGGPVQVLGPMVRINFNAGAVGGYNFTYSDPNDPTRATYEVRWAVVTTVQGANVVSKRFIVGAWRRSRSQVRPPVTIDDWVQR